MEINKVELDPKVETFIESEQEKYETSNGITCNYTPFCFVAKHSDEIIGAVSGASFFSEIYIDELVVKDVYRGKGINHPKNKQEPRQEKVTLHSSAASAILTL